MNRGRNAGVSGIVDIPGKAAKFECRVYGFQEVTALQEIGTSGPTLGDWASTLHYRPSGSIVLMAEVRKDGWPVPSSIDGCDGTLTLCLDGLAKQTLHIHVTKCNIDFSEGGKGDKGQPPGSDTWRLTITADIAEPPTWAGFGNGTPQPTNDPDAAADIQTWEGMQKVVDTSPLTDSAQRRYLVWGVTWSDAADAAKALGLLGELAAPMTRQKARTATVARLSSLLAIVTLSYGRTTTAEDVTLPETRTTVDPSGLTSEATSAAINGTPTTPTGDAYVKTGSTTRYLNDAAILTIDTYGLRTSQQSVEMDGSSTTSDPLDIADEAKVTSVTTSATPATAPTLIGYVYRTVTTQQLNPGHWRHTYEYGIRTTQEDIEYSGSFTLDDPSDIADEIVLTKVQSSSTPSAPATPGGLVLYETKTAQHSGGKWIHAFTYRRRNRAQEIEQEGTKIETDPTDLRTRGEKTTVHATGVTPSYTAPSGMSIVSSYTQELGNAKSKTVWNVAKDSNIQAAQQDASYTDDDPNGLQSRAAVGLVDATPSLPAGYVERFTRSKNLTHDHTLYTVEGGVRDTIDDVEMPGTHAELDPLKITSEGMATDVYVTAGGAPSAPAAPSPELQIVSAGTQELDRTHSRKVWNFATVNSEQRLEYPHSKTLTDPNDLSSMAGLADVFLNVSPPADPATPWGLKLRQKFDVPVTPDKSLRVWEYAKQDSKDAIEQPGTWVYTDPSDIESKGKETDVYAATGSPPAATVPSGLQKVGTHISFLNDDEKQVVYDYEKDNPQQRVQQQHTFTLTDPNGIASEAAAAGLDGTPSLPVGFIARGTRRIYITHDHYLDVATGGTRSTVDDIEMPGTETVLDPQAIESTGKITSVYTTLSGEPSDPGAPSAELQLVASAIQEINATKSRKTFHYDVVNSAQKAQYQHTRDTTDPQGLDSTTLTSSVFVNASPPADPATPSGQVLIEKFDLPLTPAKSVRVWRFGPRTSKDDIEMPASVTTDDASDIDDEQTIVQVQNSSTPAPPATPAGLKLRHTESRQLKSGKWRHAFQYARKTRADDLVYGETVARFTSTGGAEYTNASIYASTDTAYQIAHDNWLANKADVTYDSTEVRKLHDGTAVIITKWKAAFQIITASFTGGKRYAMARVNGGKVQVYFAEIIKSPALVGAGTYGYWVRVSAQKLWQSIGRFSLHRRVSGSVLPMNWNLMGTTNNANFLGLDSGTVSYVGADPELNLAIPASRVSDMTWYFEYDSLGIYDEADIVPGWYYTKENLTGVTAGWNDADKLTWSADVLSDGDYSVFLA